MAVDVAVGVRPPPHAAPATCAGADTRVDGSDEAGTRAV